MKMVKEHEILVMENVTARFKSKKKKQYREGDVNIMVVEVLCEDSIKVIHGFRV